MSVSFSTVIQKLRPMPKAATSPTLDSYLSKIPETIVSRLSNGVFVASESFKGLSKNFPAHTEFATVGISIQAGSAYEDREKNGCAALLQKCSIGATQKFKNTDKLGAKIDQLGGHFHASTKRDRTNFYFKCHKSDIRATVNLLAEMVRNPLLNQETIDKARKMQLVELKDAEEDTEGVMMNNMHIAAFDSTPRGYGATPMGTAEAVQSVTESDIRSYLSSNWTAGRIALIGCGAVDHAELESYAQEHFGDMSPVTTGSPSTKSFDRSGLAPRMESRFVGGDIKLWNLRMKVSHFAWAFETCGADCGDIVPLTLLTHIHGPYHRSQHDLVQHSFQLTYKCMTAMDHSTPTNTHFPEKGIECVNPFFHSYEDVGLLGKAFTGRPEPTGTGIANNFMDYVQLTMMEFTRMSQKAVHPNELEAAKVMYKSQLLMGHDGATNSFEDISKQIFYRGRRVPIAEMFARVDDITPTNVMEVLQHYYYSRRPVLSYSGYVYMTPSYDLVLHWTNKYFY
ncbi:mitochondrial processing peptidase [Perkinsela sp. CCAP 1560/4]|nr:mitochondrial processing peptidase [Perkinsela sp. CCAP 1560/4]|eukprot:KNH07535.1 mitochondrial processing peptidase [Perkinsela sp. CCAP 1560/4]